MPVKSHTYHYIYKTTCEITKRFYIGMHSCSNLEDGYLGSGKRLLQSIKKHGRNNHTKLILEYLPDRSSLIERERDVVNSDLLNDELCLNLRVGGEGGYNGINERIKWLLENDPIWAENFIRIKKESGSRVLKAAHAAGKCRYDTFKGKHHSEETKRKISVANSKHQKGSGNSQFGTKWITNGVDSEKVPKDSILPEGWRNGRKIKKK